MVEFAAVLMPVMLIVVGIIQFGLLFGANVTLTNAAREGARAGTIYVFNSGLSNDPATARTLNDQDRCSAVVQAATSAFGMLSIGAPHFEADRPCSLGQKINNYTWVNHDVKITYCRPTTTTPAAGECLADTSVAANDPRSGYRMTVDLAYRSDIVVPLIGPILGGGSLFSQRATITMVIN